MKYRKYQKTYYRRNRKNPGQVQLVMILLSIAVISGLLTSCVSNKKYESAVADKEKAEQQLASLKVDKTFDEYEVADRMYEKDGVVYKQSRELVEKGKKLDSLKDLVSAQKLALLDAERIINELSDQNWFVDEVEGYLKLDLSASLLFSLNSAEVTEDGKALVADLASDIQELDNNLGIKVVGHTDNQQYTDKTYDNWELSADRALAVVRLLEQNNIDPSDIKAEARGAHDPKASNETEEGRMVNRRVEIQLIPKGGMNHAISQLLTAKS